MSNLLEVKRTAKIIPFEQDGEFYYKKALRFMENKNYYNALFYYRKALSKEPYNNDYLLSLAETYTEMCYYQESNRALFLVSQNKDDDVAPDFYFGLGCNFMGMHEYKRAEDAFETYLQLDPEGQYSDDVYDMLDAIQSHEMLTYENGLKKSSSRTSELLVLAQKGKTLLDNGKYNEAINIFLEVLEAEPNFLHVKNNLSLAYFMDGNHQKAVSIAQEVLKGDDKNIHARCNVALFFNADDTLGNYEEALEQLKKIKPDTDDYDDLLKIATTFCELGCDKQAYFNLKKVLKIRPFNKKILHYIAVACFNLGSINNALEYWEDILKIDPLNIIATHFKSHALNIINGKKHTFRLAYNYQAPTEDVMARIKKIKELVDLDIPQLKLKWKEDSDFYYLILWGLEYRDINIKKAMMNFIASMSDEKAEYVIRDFVLRKNETDEIKKEAFALLKQMGAEEPYVAYINGNIVEVRVNVYDKPTASMPKSYKAVMDYLIDSMRGRIEDEYVNEAIGVWDRYISALNKRLPAIQNKEVWAAALEYYVLKNNQHKVTKKEIYDLYEVNGPTFNQCYKKLVEKLKD